MMKRKKMQVAACAVCMALLLSGCAGKASVIPVGQEEQAQQEGGVELKQMQPLNGQKWTKELTFGSNIINIDAEIMIPELSAMQIISLEEQSMAPEHRKELLEKFCENPYVLDRWNPPTCYKMQNLPMLQETRENKDMYLSSSWDKQIIENQLALLDAWENQSESGDEKVSENYQELDYYGEYNGRDYYFRFGNNEYYSLMSRMEDLGSEAEPPLLDIVNQQKICCFAFEPANYEGLMHNTTNSDMIDFSSYQMTNGELGENLCELSVDEAQKLAEDFLEKMGYTELAVKVTNEIGWNSKQELVLDGYQFDFYRYIDGIPLDEEKISYCCLKHSDYDCGGCMTERYQIYVTDAGVIAGCIQSPYLEKEIISADTKIMSCEQAKKVFESLLSTDEYAHVSVDFNALRLTYGMQHMDDDCVIIPVWRLEYQTTVYDDVTQEKYIDGCCSVVINAIDGSVIDPGDEMEE